VSAFPCVISTNIYLGGYPCLSEHKTSSGKGRKCAPGRCGGKTRKCEPGRTAWGGMCNRDHCGWVRASKITLSGAVCCSRIGRAWGGTHSDVNVHAARFLAMQQPGLPWTGLCEWNNPQRGRAVQQEGTCTGGHAQQCECACSQVPGDAVPFHLFNEFKKAHVRRVTICGRSGPIIGACGTDTKNCTS